MVCLCVYCFTSNSRIFHQMDTSPFRKGLQNLGLCAWHIRRKGCLSCHTCFDTGLLAKELSRVCDLLRQLRDTEDVFNPGSLKDIVINLK